jgi:uncharacterized RmlC-like cupin family protein
MTAAGEAEICAVGAGVTTAGAVAAGGGAFFFLQPATATKATSNTTGTRIRYRRSNGFLLQKTHEHFPDDLTYIPCFVPSCPHIEFTLRAAMVSALIVHEKAMVEASVSFSLWTKKMPASSFAMSFM